jgi:hypothetical protein
MFRVVAVLILLGAAGRGSSEPIWIQSEYDFSTAIASESLKSSGFNVSEDTPEAANVISDYSKENRIEFFSHGSTVGDALEKFESLLQQALSGGGA